MRRSAILFIILSLVAPLAFSGCGTGNTGPAGASAPTTGTLAGTVTDAVKGDALSGVTVTAKDSGGTVLGTAATDNTGSYTLGSLPLGTVTVYFSKTYYTPPGGLIVGVLAGQTVTINATMSEAASGMPSVAITGYNNGMYTTDDFGYGGTAALAASGNDPNGDTLTYSWSNATSPVLGSVTGSGTSGTVAFPAMTAAFASRYDSANLATISGYNYSDNQIGRFGILPITPDTRGQVTAKVTVSDGRGQSASVTLTLNAASVLTGVPNVAVGTRVYMNRGNDNASQTWTLIPPTGSTAALDNASSRTPSFVADIAGSYALSAGGSSTTIHAGNWVGVITGGSGNSITVDSACTGCHNDITASDGFTPWLGTAHSTMFTRGINGGNGSFYGVGCLVCHTVGFDRGTANGGFDDLAAASGWVFPSTLAAGNWDNMVATFPVQNPNTSPVRLANIQCENCHGPQNSGGHGSTGPIDSMNLFTSSRISFSAEQCATCHASGAGYHIYSEWTTLSDDGMGHSNRSRAIASGTSAHCGRCHSVQGFQIYLDQLDAGTIGNIASSTWSSVTAANVEPVTCTACHDPMDATNPHQLRVYDNSALLPAGFRVAGFGKGALCVTCHNSRNGAQSGSTTQTYLHEDTETYNSGDPTGYSAPHQACQSDVFAGRNAYFMGGTLPMISKHAAVEDTCVGCHMELQPATHLSHGSTAHDTHRFIIADNDVATLCANCHSSSVNGEGIQASIEAGLVNLKSKIETAAQTKFSGMADNIAVTGATDPATDTTIGSGSGNFSGSLVTSVELEELHGQIAFIFNTSSPVTFGSASASRFAVQLGNIKNATTALAVYALNGNMVRAGWNYFLIEGDGTKGIHNPTFAQLVLNNTLAQDVSF
ncbi:MAG: carboxypeptidase-like regulatory domain-containing protein [Deltaproteobacteria bacterium]|nr:carboxypeptidase-like regulatory domain-containing protein [Deltaproteobacteria bacterium]